MIRTLLLSAAFCAYAAAGTDGGDPVVRVAISRDTRQFNLRTSQKAFLLEIRTGQKYQLVAESLYKVKYLTPSRLAVAGQNLLSPVKILAADGREGLKLNGRSYRGEIYLKTTETEKLEVVEHLSIEEYLCGVLPGEMSPGWPAEALKAQAVASRTYALKKIDPKKDYDMTDGSDTQVYNGTAGDDPRIRKAVFSTRGEVLTYKGGLITAFFHACCGGHTSAASSAWGETPVKPLRGVSDPFCSLSKHYRWEFYITARDLLSFIQSHGSTALRIRSVHLHKRDASGRSRDLKFLTDAGPFTVSAKEFRKSFGTRDVKSTLLTGVRGVKGGYQFSGKGWGHGVGMCQDGARRMANKGMDYRRILRHYYPGAKIKEMKGGRI